MQTNNSYHIDKFIRYHTDDFYPKIKMFKNISLHIESDKISQSKFIKIDDKLCNY